MFNVLPPDYLGQLQEPSVLGVFGLVLNLYSLLILSVIMNAILMSGTVWWMLFICRFLGIPWIDGTTKGFVNRR